MYIEHIRNPIIILHGFKPFNNFRIKYPEIFDHNVYNKNTDHSHTYTHII